MRTLSRDYAHLHQKEIEEHRLKEAVKEEVRRKLGLPEIDPMEMEMNEEMGTHDIPPHFKEKAQKIEKESTQKIVDKERRFKQLQEKALNHIALGEDVPDELIKELRAVQPIDPNREDLLNLNSKEFTPEKFKKITKNAITIAEGKRLVKRRDELKGFKSWEEVLKTPYIGEDDLYYLQLHFKLGKYE